MVVARNKSRRVGGANETRGTLKFAAIEIRGSLKFATKVIRGCDDVLFVEIFA